MGWSLIETGFPVSELACWVGAGWTETGSPVSVLVWCSQAWLIETSYLVSGLGAWLDHSQGAWELGCLSADNYVVVLDLLHPFTFTTEKKTLK